MTVPFLPGRRPTGRGRRRAAAGALASAVVHFRPFGDDARRRT